MDNSNQFDTRRNFAVEQYVVADGKDPQSRRYVVTGWPHFWVSGELQCLLFKSIQQCIGRNHIVMGDMTPDTEQVEV
jgi:hypothetical protein